MKKMLVLTAAVLCGPAVMLCAQPQPLICTEPGTQLEYADYDSRGELVGYSVTEVVGNVADEGGRLVTMRTVRLDALRQPVEDKKAGRVTTVEKFLVGENEMSVLLDHYFSNLSGDGWDARIESSDGRYIIPYAMRAGEVLPEQEIVLTACASDGFELKMKFRIAQRRVLAEEDLAVPAGTFRTVCLSERMRCRVWGIGATVAMKTWYAPAVGPVLTEQMAGNGAVESRSELIAIRRPAQGQ